MTLGKKDKIISYLKIFTIYLMSFGYIWIGIKHLTDSEFFLRIMPPFLPFHIELVYLSGAFEIILGIGLLINKYRKLVSWALIILLIGVYPANIYLAFNSEPQQAINISPFLASWVRLPLQFVFIALAYWHTKSEISTQHSKFFL